MTPSERTLKNFRDRGITIGRVEQWIPRARKRRDLFSILDYVALDHLRGVIGIQSTGTGFAEHDKMLLGEKAKACIDWLMTPGTNLELWGWRTVKVKRGGKAKVWQPRVKIYTLEDFERG